MEWGEIDGGACVVELLVDLNLQISFFFLLKVIHINISACCELMINYHKVPKFSDARKLFCNQP